MLPILTMVGMDVGLAFAGAVFVERVYGLPGVGNLLYNALGRRDMPVILGVVLLVTTAILIFNLLVDLLVAWLDPRIRVVEPHTTKVRRGAGAPVAPASSPAPATTAPG
jgi:ABC-type dipeptide/oligopeptide/nickel transport system permease component